MRSPRLTPLVALAVLPLASCFLLPGNRTDVFPLEVGFQPLEDATDAPLPAMNADGTYPQALGTVTEPAADGHFAAHGRGYLLYPLAKVYQAMHDPQAGRLHTTGSASVTDPWNEPFPISYAWHYEDSVLGGMVTVQYDVVYRGGVFEGTEAAPTKVGTRYQKTSGVEAIYVLTGSTVALPTPDPNVTEVDIVAWLRADTQTQGSDDNTVRDQFANLEAVLAAMP